MKYEEAVAYIDKIVGVGSKIGLVRITRLLERLGNPQKNLKVIHVAGTNGKGSTCAMLMNILMEAGIKTGMYTSPHLQVYNERYVINNKMIDNIDFAYYMSVVKEQCENMVADGEGQPIVFEILTAIAFLYFKDKKTDYVILEVGLGGRLDSTNVIEKPILCVITAIGMDHMNFLGNTIEEIAMEKGGIIKENCPVVLYSQKKQVYDSIQKICKEKQAELYYAETEEVKLVKQNLEGSIFSLRNQYINYDKIELNLLGEYQIKNCAVVLLCCKILIEAGILLTEQNIREGIRKTHWNGRMEICGKNPLLLIDGAHNYDGIAMLVQSLEKYFPLCNITFVIGMLEDKEYEKMIGLLLPLAKKIVITEPNAVRKLDADKLEKLVCQKEVEIYKQKEILKALECAKQITDKSDVVCCAGSLYMIGKVRDILYHEKAWENFE